jgi:hypothetical protein
MRCPKAAGKQAAPGYRRTPGIQHLIEDGLNFLDVSLDRERHFLSLSSNYQVTSIKEVSTDKKQVVKSGFIP